MNTGPSIDSYEWAGGREAMLRFGPEDGAVVVLALPLFEEANRTRAFGVSILRALAGRGIGGVLPELPGQGESEVATALMTLADLRTAFAAAPGTHTVAIRSGALLVDVARPGWFLAPQDGPALLRELSRVKGSALTGELVEVAGNLLSRALLDDLQTATHPGEPKATEGQRRSPVAMSNEALPTLADPSQLGPRLRGGRVVRLTSDRQPADRHVEGQPLWRRAEPGNDLVLAEILAADIAEWIVSCAA